MLPIPSVSIWVPCCVCAVVPLDLMVIFVEVLSWGASHGVMALG